MTYIPNTPGELFKLNDGPFPENPYDAEQVRAALDALDPNNGGTPAHWQAMAEHCISALRIGYEEFLKDEAIDPELAEYATEMINNLLGAEALVERAHFIDGNGNSAYGEES
jgi:cytochrome c556